MTSDQRKFESLAALCDFSRKMLRPPRNASIYLIWPTGGERWSPVKTST